MSIKNLINHQNLKNFSKENPKFNLKKTKIVKKNSSKKKNKKKPKPDHIHFHNNDIDIPHSPFTYQFPS